MTTFEIFTAIYKELEKVNDTLRNESEGLRKEYGLFANASSEEYDAMKERRETWSKAIAKSNGKYDMLYTITDCLQKLEFELKKENL